jgi:hypothetical protein
MRARRRYGPLLCLTNNAEPAARRGHGPHKPRTRQSPRERVLAGACIACVAGTQVASRRKARHGSSRTVVHEGKIIEPGGHWRADHGVRTRPGPELFHAPGRFLLKAGSGWPRSPRCRRLGRQLDHADSLAVNAPVIAPTNCPIVVCAAVNLATRRPIRGTSTRSATEHLGHVVRDENHGDAPVADPLALHDAQGGGRLVHEGDLAGVGDRPRHGDGTGAARRTAWRPTR